MDASTISTMIADCGTLVTEVVNCISENSVLTTIMGCGLVGAGARLFRKLARTSKSPG